MEEKDYKMFSRIEKKLIEKKSESNESFNADEMLFMINNISTDVMFSPAWVILPRMKVIFENDKQKANAILKIFNHCIDWKNSYIQDLCYFCPMLDMPKKIKDAIMLVSDGILLKQNKKYKIMNECYNDLVK